MVKRKAEQNALDDQRIAKRSRPSSVDRLSHLSDELILRLLSFLPVSQLIVTQRYAGTPQSTEVYIALKDQIIAQVSKARRRRSALESPLLQSLCPAKGKQATGSKDVA